MKWPRTPRRIFALTFPITGPIWIAGLILGYGMAIVVALCFLALMYAVFLIPAIGYKLWTREKTEIWELIFEAPPFIYRTIKALFIKASP